MDYLKEIESCCDILQKLLDHQKSIRRKQGNLAFLLIHQKRELEKIAGYIRRFGIDAAEEMEKEDE